ncbi:hypothetical protein FQN54_002448 [Arachnomyces sp. PD_36]|nr:hypothetical protein FQN54_002448 [Arachnomyces sp. PD_36]
MPYRIRPGQFTRLGRQQICRAASSSSGAHYPRYGERGLRKIVGSRPKTGGKNELPQLEKVLVNGTKEQDGIEAAEAPSPSDQIALESANLLEKYGLSTIPSNNSSPGVEIDQFGQMSITSEADSRRKHRTALILSRASPSLSEHDFRKLLGTGKHIDGWRGQGGLEQIIPLRHHRTLLRSTSWALIFTTPAHAKEYQEKATLLRKQAGYHTPTSPSSQIAPPPNFVAGGTSGLKIQDYTLTSPWLNISLVAQLSPFDFKLQRAIDIHEKLKSPQSRSTDKQDPGLRRAERSFPVRFWVDQHNLMELTPEIINRILIWDGAFRGSRWQVLEGEAGIQHLVDLDKPDIMGNRSNSVAEEDDQSGSLRRADNWRINFRHASEARRFMRIWHRTPLPKFSGLPYSDPQPLVKVECLF